MPTVPFFSNSFNERQPLLKPRTTPGAGARIRADLEAASAPAESEDPNRVWKLLWYLIMNTCLIIGAFITAMNDEGGAGFNYAPLTHPASNVFLDFDFKWALWCALGSGLSGAAGMSVQYTY